LRRRRRPLKEALGLFGRAFFIFHFAFLGVVLLETDEEGKAKIRL
jgi:hypothetical protein